MADIIGDIIRPNADNIEINSCGSIICVRFEGIISAFFPHAPSWYGLMHRHPFDVRLANIVNSWHKSFPNMLYLCNAIKTTEYGKRYIIGNQRSSCISR